MKKLVTLCAALLFSLAANAFQETVIPLADRANGVTVTSKDIVADKTHSGIRVTTQVTSVTTTPTITFSVEAKSPQGEYYTVLASTAIAPVAGTVNVLKVGPGITAAANLSVAENVPTVYRIKAVVGGTGSSIFSIGVAAN